RRRPLPGSPGVGILPACCHPVSAVPCASCRGCPKIRSPRFIFCRLHFTPPSLRGPHATCVLSPAVQQPRRQRHQFLHLGDRHLLGLPVHGIGPGHLPDGRDPSGDHRRLRPVVRNARSEEHTTELPSREKPVCRRLLGK